MSSATIEGPADAVVAYAAVHKSDAVALPEFVDAVAERSGATAHDAKSAIFRFIDRGHAYFTPDFMVRFA